MTEKYKLNREYDTIMRDEEHWLITSIDTLDNAEKICKELNDKEEQIIKLNELAEENLHLKKELKRCKDWINSDKYDYELTLAFIKSKGYSLKDVLEYEKGVLEND